MNRSDRSHGSDVASAVLMLALLLAMGVLPLLPCLLVLWALVAFR